MKYKNQYLNEEKYQSTRKKLIIIAFVFLILGVLGGVILINTAKQKSKEHEILVQEKLEIIKFKREELEKKLSDKSYECDSLDMKDPNWFADAGKCRDQELKLRGELTDLDYEESVVKREEGPEFLYFVLGGISIFTGIVIFGGLLATAKRREILAFHAQQVMPVGKEIIEDVAPTVGSAVGTISKDLAKGIKEGINETD